MQIIAGGSPERRPNKKHGPALETWPNMGAKRSLVLICTTFRFRVVSNYLQPLATSRHCQCVAPLNFTCINQLQPTEYSLQSTGTTGTGAFRTIKWAKVWGIGEDGAEA